MGDQFNPSQPIYLQIVQRISRQIIRGDLNPGDRLPSVRETALGFGVNPNTVQRAYAELERMGIVETRRGQGSFVTEDTNKLQELREQLKNEQIEAFLGYMREMGFNTEEVIQSIKDYANK